MSTEVIKTESFGYMAAVPLGVGLRGYDSKELSEATGLDTGDETIVQQNFAAEADINNLVKRFGITGALPLGPNGPAIYGDFSGITDYEAARETMRRADAAFMSLPADVREKFGNDPAKLIDFVQTRPEAEFMSLFDEPAKPANDGEVS